MRSTCSSCVRNVVSRSTASFVLTGRSDDLSISADAQERVLRAALELIYRPVWFVIYRYKRQRKKLWIDGASGAIEGQSVSLLTQWFG